MTGKKSPRKPRPRITEQQISDMMRLRRQGESISAIARAIKCNRQTVRVYLKERQADVLADEVRKQQLTDELQRHLNDVTEFAVSFKSCVTVPRSPTEDRDASAVFELLLGKDLPRGLDWESRQARREQRQRQRRNRMLLISLQEHTRGQGWWAAYEEWQEIWNICLSAIQELRGEADKVVENRINEKPSLKEEVERQSSKRGRDDTVRRIVSDMLLVVWGAATGSEPVEKFEFIEEEGRIVACFADGTPFPLGHRLIEVSVSSDMADLYKLAFETLCQSFSDKHIPEMLQRMDEKIEVIDDALDPFVLRPLLVRTRCTLCPV
ncbi:hypothetical protein ES708_09064 [subsurface metagenome]